MRVETVCDVLKIVHPFQHSCNIAHDQGLLPNGRESFCAEVNKKHKALETDFLWLAGEQRQFQRERARVQAIVTGFPIVA